jgi:hypothetical protein
MDRVPGTVGLACREAEATGRHHEHDAEEQVVHMHVIGSRA